MPNFLDTSKCHQFQPTFDDRECSYYSFAEDSDMEPIPGECGFCSKPQAYRCVADIARIIPLSHSSVDTFLTCHYQYYLKKILGIELRPPFFGPALKGGKLWDVVKQKYLGAKDLNIKAVIDEYEIEPIVVEKVKALYRVYKDLEMEVDLGYTLQHPVSMSYDVLVPSVAFTPPISLTSSFWNIRKDLEADNRHWIFPLSMTGFYDRKYENYFSEDKLSSKPEFYLDPFLMQSQNGTYFAADPELEYCIQEVVLFPQQWAIRGRNESATDIGARVYKDVLSSPSKYFLGYDRKKHMYGKKFYRGEFDLQAIEDRYKQVVMEILSCRWTGNFYRNFKSCNNVLPGISCDMLPICRSGNMSESMYRVRGNV